MKSSKLAYSLCVFAFLSVLSHDHIVGQGFQNINVDALRRSVVFIYVPCDGLNPAPQGCVAGGQTPDGTGFLVMVPHKGGGSYLVLVTARHMVDPVWAGCAGPAPTMFHVHLNKSAFDPAKNEDGTIDAPVQNSEGFWKFPNDDSADVAVILVNAKLFEASGTENLPINLMDFPNQQEAAKVKTGDQVISAGFLQGVTGVNRNYPIFKFGYVSSIPGEKIAMQCCPACSQKLLSQWMIAANLVPGNSGSPIFFVPSYFQSGGDPRNTRPVLLGIQSTSLMGDDVAGMTPVKFLIEAIKNLNLKDADLTISGVPYKGPTVPPVPASTPR